MRLWKPLLLLALLASPSGCSTDPDTGAVVLQRSIKFEHRTQARSDGKTMLIVAPVEGVVRDRALVDQEAQTYAETVVKRTCPSGYDFYGHAALMSRKGERTFVFQCR